MKGSIYKYKEIMGHGVVEHHSKEKPGLNRPTAFRYTGDIRAQKPCAKQCSCLPA